MGREREIASGPFNFAVVVNSRLSSRRVECLRTAAIRVEFPAAAPILHRLRVSTRPSLQNSANSGQHGGSLPNHKSKIVNSFGAVAEK